jgi:hypothetical protein
LCLGSEETKEIIRSPNNIYEIEKRFEPPSAEADSVVHNCIATLRSNGKVIWTYIPPRDARGIWFSWAPSSKAFLMIQHDAGRSMKLWLLRVQERAMTMIDLNLDSIWSRMSDFLKDKQTHSAPMCGVDVDAIEWKNPNVCKLRYYFRGSGDGNAELVLDASEEWPRLNVTKTVKVKH